MRRAALAFGFHDLLEGISSLLERECTLLPGTAHPEATLQLSHAAQELRASISLGYEHTLVPLKTDFKFHGGKSWSWFRSNRQRSQSDHDLQHAPFVAEGKVLPRNAWTMLLLFSTFLTRPALSFRELKALRTIVSWLRRLHSIIRIDLCCCSSSNYFLAKAKFGPLGTAASINKLTRPFYMFHQALMAKLQFCLITRLKNNLCHDCGEKLRSFGFGRDEKRYIGSDVPSLKMLTWTGIMGQVELHVNEITSLIELNCRQ